VVFQHHLIQRVTAVLGLLGLLIVLPGCPLTPDETGGGGDDTRLTETRETPDGTIRRQGQIWAQRRYQEYTEILHDKFEFYIFEGDAIDFPWLEADFWTRTVELEMASNMFDENFSGDEPPVDQIKFDYNILIQRDTFDGDGNPIVEITADAIAEVLIGPHDGWSSDTRFVFDVVEDPDEPGLWQIKRQQEIEKL
jgi:hypothetical protein